MNKKCCNDYDGNVNSKQQIRREKSRDAARSRRERESNEITVLAQSLPLPSATISNLDKSSVIRLATGYMLCRELARFGLSDAASYKVNMFDGNALEALSGFIFVVTPGGKIIYISENVVSHLGLSSVDLHGLSIYDYLHAADAQEFSNNIRSACNELTSAYCKNLNEKGKWHEIFIRMKSAFYKNQTVTPKSPDYKTLRCTGRCCLQFRSSSGMLRNDINATNDISTCFICYAEPLPCIVSMDVPIQQYYFKTTFTLDLKFSYCDTRLNDWTGYDSMELYGMSLYQFCDTEDDQRTRMFHKNLILKGQCVLTNLKILAKYGGWIMVYLRASVTCDSVAPSPQRIEAVGCVIGTSNARDITSLKQCCENLDCCAVSVFERGLTFTKNENAGVTAADSKLPSNGDERVKMLDEVTSVESVSEEASGMKWLADVLEDERFPSNVMLDDYDAQDEICKDKEGNCCIREDTTSLILVKDDYDDLAPFVPPPNFDNRLPDNFVSLSGDMYNNQEFVPDCAFLPIHEISEAVLATDDCDLLTHKRYAHISTL